jgi:hypothetical protein
MDKCTPTGPAGDPTAEECTTEYDKARVPVVNPWHAP